MPMKYLFIVLRSRVWLIAAIALTTVAVGAWFTFTQPKTYVATSSLLLNFATENPFEDDGLPPQLADSYIATQVDIITSRNVLLRVVNDLSLASEPAQVERWVRILRDHVEVEAGPDSRLISINYEAADPNQAARVANAFAGAYVDTTQQLAVEPAKRNTAWFDTQLAGMRDRLAGAQSRLTSFQQEKGIVALDEQLDTETTRLNELNNQLVTAQAELRDVRSRQLGVNHPEYARVVDQVENVQQSLEQQKGEVLALKQQRDELQVLARELNVEQNAYEGALQSYYNERLRSSVSQTRVELLDPAVAPDEADSPDVALNLVGSTLLGLVLAGLFAIGTELAFRKIRTVEDADELLDTKVLGSV